MIVQLYFSGKRGPPCENRGRDLHFARRIVRFEPQQKSSRNRPGLLPGLFCYKDPRLQLGRCGAAWQTLIEWCAISTLPADEIAHQCQGLTLQLLMLCPILIWGCHLNSGSISDKAYNFGYTHFLELQAQFLETSIDLWWLLRRSHLSGKYCILILQLWCIHLNVIVDL